MDDPYYVIQRIRAGVLIKLAAVQMRHVYYIIHMSSECITIYELHNPAVHLKVIVSQCLI